MKHFTIENDNNNITVHGSAKEAEGVPDSERFSNEAALATLAANWPAARLVEIWNSLPGATPVKKFKDRPTAVSRIWKALQSLGQTETVAGGEAIPEAALVAHQVEETGDEVQPEPVLPERLAPVVDQLQEVSETDQVESIPETTDTTTDTHVAPQTPDVAPDAATVKNKATRVKKTPKPAADAGMPREGSKTSQVIEMLKREGGTTLEEIMAAMGWLKHTTRAMLSAGGSLTKKHGLVIVSEKVGDKRVYSIKG
jgi:hypothetical protein